MLHRATSSYPRQQPATSSNMSSNIRIEKTCHHCGETFVAKTTVTKFCSDRCAKMNYKKRKREEKLQGAIEQEQHKAPVTGIVSNKDFLSVKDVCVLLGASRWTIYRMIDNGQLKAAKIGRRTIISREAINQLFK